MIRLLKILLAAAAAGLAVPAGALPTVVYSSDFEGVSPDTSAWSILSSNGVYSDFPLRGSDLPIETIPAGGNAFLGQFGGDDAVTLALSGLAAAPAIRVEFDVYFIRSWDGNRTEQVGGYLNNDILREPDPNVPVGPDYFGLKVNGNLLFEHTFSLGDASDVAQWQTFCPGGGSLTCIPGSGGSEWRTLGYTIPTFISGVAGEIPADMVVHFSALLGHTADLTLAFYSRGLQLRPPAYDPIHGSHQGQGNLLLDESWGLDNIAVTAVPEPQTYVLLAIGLGILAMASRRRRAR